MNRFQSFGFSTWDHQPVRPIHLGVGSPSKSKRASRSRSWSRGKAGVKVVGWLKPRLKALVSTLVQTLVSTWELTTGEAVGWLKARLKGRLKAAPRFNNARNRFHEDPHRFQHSGLNWELTPLTRGKSLSSPNRSRSRSRSPAGRGGSPSRSRASRMVWLRNRGL